MIRGVSGAMDTGTALEQGFDRIARERTTGCVRVEVPATGSSGQVYVVDGALYSVALDGFEPRILRRMLASDLAKPGLDEGWAAALDEQDEVDPSELGHYALKQGWIGAQELSAIHHELMMAGLSSLLQVEDVHFDVRPGEVTAKYCTAPVEWHEVRPLLSQRSAKMRADTLTIQSALSHRGGSFSPSTSALKAVGDLATRGAVPREFTAFHECFRTPQTLDRAARECGYTRAEALHIGAEFATTGFVEPARRLAKSPNLIGYPVPEAFPGSDGASERNRHG